MTFLIIWWLIGTISYLIGCVLIDKVLTPQNIFDSLYIGLLGPIILIFLIYIYIQENDILPNVSLQKYKDLWKKNLLDKTDKK